MPTNNKRSATTPAAGSGTKTARTPQRASPATPSISATTTTTPTTATVVVAAAALEEEDSEGEEEDYELMSKVNKRTYTGKEFVATRVLVAGILYVGMTIAVTLDWSRATSKPHWAVALHNLLPRAVYEYTFGDPVNRAAENRKKPDDPHVELCWFQHRRRPWFPDDGLKSSRGDGSFGSWILIAKSYTGMMLLRRLVPVVTETLQRAGHQASFEIQRLGRRDTRLARHSFMVLRGLASPLVRVDPALAAVAETIDLTSPVVGATEET
jgi:hypothetical protein